MTMRRGGRAAGEYAMFRGASVEWLKGVSQRWSFQTEDLFKQIRAAEEKRQAAEVLWKEAQELLDDVWRAVFARMKEEERRNDSR